jgi:hypothetical protein
VYYYLVQALKRRLILELQDSFGQHPVYRKIAPFIQNKFVFTERPQFGIVVKGSSANKYALSADNYVGTVHSHAMLATVGQPVYPIEWVREDIRCIEEHGGMPTAPGVYFLTILEAPTAAQELGTYAIDALLTRTDEAVLVFQSGIEREAQLQQVPVADTLRLWENRQFMLTPEIDYRLGEAGAIELLKRFSPGARLTADYRYQGDPIGPCQFQWNMADYQTLPGIVMAFGKRAEAGQRVGVVVYQDRVDTAQAFGGKFESSFDLDVIARDTTQMEEIADLAIMYLWGQKKAQLEFEGIEIVDVSIGGEAEEADDEEGDLYYYTSDLSLQLRADWEIHVPLPLTISRVTPITKEGDTDFSAPLGVQRVVGDLFFAARPVMVGRNPDFERIT